MSAEVARGLVASLRRATRGNQGPGKKAGHGAHRAKRQPRRCS